jgi:hypothetical protein
MVIGLSLIVPYPPMALTSESYGRRETEVELVSCSLHAHCVALPATLAPNLVEHHDVRQGCDEIR